LQREDLADADRADALFLRAQNKMRLLQKEMKNKGGEKTFVDQKVKHIMKDLKKARDLHEALIGYIRYFKGNVYFSITKQFDKALECFRKLPKTTPEALMGIAQCLKAKNQPDEAAKHFRELLRWLDKSPSDQDSSSTIALRAQVLDQLGCYKESLENFSKGMAIAQNDEQFLAGCYRLRAEVYARIGDMEKAEKDLQLAIQLNPNKKNEYLQLDLQNTTNNLTVPFFQEDIRKSLLW